MARTYRRDAVDRLRRLDRQARRARQARILDKDAGQDDLTDLDLS